MLCLVLSSLWPVTFFRTAARCSRIRGRPSRRNLIPLDTFKYVREDNALLKTLEVFLLDAGSSVSACADLLFLHKNTVKYRLNRSNVFNLCNSNFPQLMIPPFQFWLP